MKVLYDILHILAVIITYEGAKGVCTWIKRKDIRVHLLDVIGVFCVLLLGVMIAFATVY